MKHLTNSSNAQINFLSLLLPVTHLVFVETSVEDVLNVLSNECLWPRSCSYNVYVRFFTSLLHHIFLPIFHSSIRVWKWMRFLLESLQDIWMEKTVVIASTRYCHFWNVLKPGIWWHKYIGKRMFRLKLAKGLKCWHSFLRIAKATSQTRKDNGVLPQCVKGPHKVQITVHAVEMSVTNGRQVFISYVKVKDSSGYLNL